MSAESASVAASEVRIVAAYDSGHEYEISVAFPFHYDDRPDDRWPVIYVLDGNLYFGLVVDMVRAMNIRVEFCDELPDAFVVGIGYPVIGSLSERLHQVMHHRMRDFLADPDAEAERFIQDHFPVSNPDQAGEAASFLNFVSHELVPLIDREYRTDSDDRTLVGHSWGGTFAFYTLFREPDVFQRYVVMSESAVLDDEARYAQDHDDLRVRLHLVAELEGPGPGEHEQLLRLLEGRGYPGLRATRETIDTTHCAIVAPGVQAGLCAVFSP